MALVALYMIKYYFICLGIISQEQMERISSRKIKNLGTTDGKIDPYRREIFKLKSTTQDDICLYLPLTVKSVLSLQNGFAYMGRFLYHNKNTLTTEIINLLSETI